MNIGIVTTWYERGAAYVSKAYMDSLAKYNNNVYIYARGGDPNLYESEKWKFGNVTFGKQIHIGIPTYIVWSDFHNWLQKNDIQIVLFNEQQSWDVIIRMQSLNIIIGAYVDYYTEQTVPFFSLYDFLICNTKRHYSVFNLQPQCAYIPWGTNCELFHPAIGLNNHQPITFFHSCGMSSYRKGTDILVKAFTKVKGDCKLIIHTQAPLTDPETLALISRDERIQLIQKTEPAPGLYSLGDIYVYPTRLEGIGLTIAEALASGLPVITTDNAPMNEIVQNGINGFLINVERYIKRSDNYYWPQCECKQSHLVEIMQYCVDNSNLIIGMKKQARAYAVEYLNWDKNSTSLQVFLNSCTLIRKSPKIKIKAMVYEFSRYPWLMSNAFLRRLHKSKITRS